MNLAVDKASVWCPYIPIWEYVKKNAPKKIKTPLLEKRSSKQISNSLDFANCAKDSTNVIYCTATNAWLNEWWNLWPHPVYHSSDMLRNMTYVFTSVLCLRYSSFWCFNDTKMCHRPAGWKRVRPNRKRRQPSPDSERQARSVYFSKISLFAARLSLPVSSQHQHHV